MCETHFPFTFAKGHGDIRQFATRDFALRLDTLRVAVAFAARIIEECFVVSPVPLEVMALSIENQWTTIRCSARHLCGVSLIASDDSAHHVSAVACWLALDSAFEGATAVTNGSICGRLDLSARISMTVRCMQVSRIA